ncbi:related to trfA protein [Cephalotrichum gorgonifer]|uniref:Related to trfA protein n=1 Tax=Cephalotrichum gorgonifer TaxID=2041049 RepID=A0AAE8MVW2_9PEZI|nr:related to trfA protein [Cephalotrichum gorgonifer]
MADLQHLYDHPTSHKWAAHRILPLEPATSSTDEPFLKVDKKSLSIPRIHPSTFLEHLQTHVLPDVKAHFQFDRSQALRMVILRIFIIDSPYNTSLALLHGEGRNTSAIQLARTIYVAFPDNAPFVYTSNLITVGPPNAVETKSLRTLIFEGIRKALSKPRERYTLMSTGMTTRNLLALMQFRGPGRSNAAGGGWGIYAKDTPADTPLDGAARTEPLSEVSGNVKGVRQDSPLGKRMRRTGLAVPVSKRAKLLAQARFGDSARTTDGHGLERVDIVMEDPFATTSKSQPTDAGGAGEESEQSDNESTAHPSSSWRPSVRLTLQGSHVFAGIRQLVESGVIDGERMPGWLTGEDNVTTATVRDGRIRAHRGLEV